jgi:hypothetical protein
LGLLFLLFSFKKVHDAFAQLRFHCRLPKSQCRSYLIPRNETIIASSGHVDLCQILCLKREFVPSLKLHGPDFLNCQVAIAFRQQGGGGLSLGFCRFLLSVYFYIRISDAPFKWIVFFVQLIGGVCLFCHLSETLNSGCFVRVALLAILQNLFLKNTRLLHSCLFTYVLLTIDRPIHYESINW